MRINITEAENKNKFLTLYSFLSQSLQKWLIENIEKEGTIVSISSNQVVYDVPDNNSVSEILKDINTLLDEQGIHAIIWLNSLFDVRQVKSEVDIPKITDLGLDLIYRKYKYVLVTNYPAYNYLDLQQDKAIEILKTTGSYEEASMFAESYLEKIGFSKRIYRSYDPVRKIIILWKRR